MKNNKRILSAVLAAAMIGSTLTACSAANKQPSNQEKEFLNTGSYEGCGLKFEYDPTVWVNVKNEGSGVGKSVLLYTKNYDSLVEVSRIDETVQTMDDVETYINQKIADVSAFSKNASVEDVEMRVIDEGTAHAKYRIVLTDNADTVEEKTTTEENNAASEPLSSDKADESTESIEPEKTNTNEENSKENTESATAPVKNTQEFIVRMNVYLEDGQSACVYSETMKQVQNKYADSVNEIMDSFAFSDVENPGEAHTEEERLYNLTPTITDIEGYSYVKDIEYTDQEDNVRHAYCIPNQSNAPYIYDHTAVSVFDGITMLTSTLKKENAEQDALSVIKEGLGTWYDAITANNSGFFSSKINQDYRTLTKDGDTAAYVVAYAPYNTVENSSGEVEHLASEVYESIVICKENGNYIEVTEIEIQKSYMTETTEKAMQELAEIFGLDYEQLMTPFSGEFKMDPTILKTPDSEPVKPEDNTPIATEAPENAESDATSETPAEQTETPAE